MNKIFVLLLGTLVLFSACRKEIVKKDDNSGIATSMDDLTISSDFNWKTTKEYQISFTAITSGLIKVENNNGIVFQSAFLQANETYKMKLSIPSYQKTVHLKFMNEDVILQLDNSELDYNFN